MFKYEKLALQLSLQISSGQFKAGSRFPSIRETSSRFNFGINTVKTAYHILEDQGYIGVKAQSGYYVKGMSCQSASSIYAASINKLPISGVEKILTNIVQLKSDPDYVDLALACPDGERYFPARKMKKLITKILREKPDYLTQYVLPPGSAVLREQIAQRSVEFGVSVTPEDIILTHGTMDALSIAIQAVSKVGDSIAVEMPTFYNLYPIIKRLGRVLYEVPTSAQQGMCLDSLEQAMHQKKVTAVLCIPTGHNPLGFTMPLDARERLAQLAHRFDVPVIENAIYADLQYGETLPHIKAFDQNGLILTCSSFTKTIAPDFRIGWLDAARYTELAKHIKLSSSVTESLLLSDVIGTFLKTGGYEKHMALLRDQYSLNLANVRHLIMQHFPKNTRITAPKAGFILWLELPEEVNTLKLYELALKESILCMPGVLCSLDQQHKNCLRVPVCRDIDERYVKAVEVLGKIACSMLPPPKASFSLP